MQGTFLTTSQSFKSFKSYKMNDKVVLRINSNIKPKQSSKKVNRLIVSFQVPLYGCL